MLKIGFFSLKDNVGCTSIAIHVANYLAEIEKTSVCVIEPEKKSIVKEESVYAKCNVDYEDDGTFVTNNVRFYPSKRRKAWIYDTFEDADTDRQPSEDIRIYDFGKVSFLHEFDSDFDKLYLCTDGEDFYDEISFLKETKTESDVILFGASKELLNTYQAKGLKCIMIGNKKEERLPFTFACQLEVFLRLKGITPPTYHNNWTYAKIEFDYRPAPKPEEKQGFFDKFKKNKKKETVIKDTPEDEKIEEETKLDSGIQVAVKQKSRDANVYTKATFVNVPVPQENNVKEEQVKTSQRRNLNAGVEDEPTQENLDGNDEIKQVEMSSTPSLSADEKDVQEKLNGASDLADDKNEDISCAKKITAQNSSAEKINQENNPKNKNTKTLAKNKATKETKAKKTKEKPLATSAAAGVNNQALDKKAINKGSGLLASLIKYVIKDKDNVCNIFIVTKSKKLFIFDEPDLFFTKLEVLKREIRDVNIIHYIIITQKNGESTRILTEDNNLDDVFAYLQTLDKDLRDHHLNEDIITKHKELVLFDEVLF